MAENDNDFRTWTQGDPRYNEEKAFDEENYPEARHRYLKEMGCIIIALAIMLRRFGIEEESDYRKFNPLIFFHRAKAAGCFDKGANFLLPKMPELYPIEQFECVPYSREAMIDSFRKGYASLLMVPGKNGPYHYIVPDEILPDDVSVIDRFMEKKLVSQYEKVYYIMNFRRIEKK